MKNKKPKNKSFIFPIIITIIIIAFLWQFTTIVMDEISNQGKESEICDYDSCSFESRNWNYSGSACFDSDNPDCQDFLRFWNACQEYKKRIGVC